MRILHIAPFNTAGVPITFVKAERKLGHHSRLITLGRDPRNYEEDICLDLPLLDFWGTRLAKKLFSAPSKMSVDNQMKIPEKKIDALFNEMDFWNFDVYQLDGGLEFFRDGRTIQRLKTLGKKVICCYTGSDLRTRGVIPAIDANSDLNVSTEFDHLQLHPDIHHVFFPFDLTNYEVRSEPESDIIRIGHAPTSRKAKGSHTIISAIKELQTEVSVGLELIENLPHKEALERKSQCHIFVDQIGELGYGINSLEALAMGIPTCSCLAIGFEEKYSNHPFIVIDENNIKQRLVDLIQSKELRTNKGLEGRKWVEEYHDCEKVVKTIHELAGLLKESRETSASLFN